MNETEIEKMKVAINALLDEADKTWNDTSDYPRVISLIESGLKKIVSDNLKTVFIKVTLEDKDKEGFIHNLKECFNNFPIPFVKEITTRDPTELEKTKFYQIII